MINLSAKGGGISILGMVLIGIIVILILSHFNVSLRSTADNPQTRDNFQYIGELIKTAWNDYLKKPVLYVWNHLILDNIEKYRKGENSIDFSRLAPTVPSR